MTDFRGVEKTAAGEIARGLESALTLSLQWGRRHSVKQDPCVQSCPEVRRLLVVLVISPVLKRMGCLAYIANSRLVPPSLVPKIPLPDEDKIDLRLGV